MAAFNKFNQFVADMANKVHNLSSDTLKVMLTNSAPAATNTNYSQLTDLPTAGGYTAGGATVTGQTSTQTGGTERLIGSLPNPTWTATSAGIGPFRYAVLYNVTAGGNLIGYWDNGSSVTLANTQTFTVAFDPTNGILQDS
jgi:hypothetical protein